MHLICSTYCNKLYRVLSCCRSYFLITFYFLINCLLTVYAKHFLMLFLLYMLTTVNIITALCEWLKCVVLWHRQIGWDSAIHINHIITFVVYTLFPIIITNKRRRAVRWQQILFFIIVFCLILIKVFTITPSFTFAALYTFLCFYQFFLLL